mgnify:CR=1 FL=1
MFSFLDVKIIVQDLKGIKSKDQTLSFDGTKLDEAVKLTDEGVQHDDIIDLILPSPSSPPPVAKPKLESFTPNKPKKSSYLPADWKRQQDRYGTVTVTTFKTRYDVEPDESFIDEVSKVTDKFKIERPVLSSKKIDG